MEISKVSGLKNEWSDGGQVRVSKALEYLRRPTKTRAHGLTAS